LNQTKKNIGSQGYTNCSFIKIEVGGVGDNYLGNVFLGVRIGNQVT
jgi:hypothetical protein